MEIKKCECGCLITGKDVNTLESNMIQHLNSVFHKKQMKLIKLKDDEEKEISRKEKSPSPKDTNLQHGFQSQSNNQNDK